ncbi:MAG: tRNA glutamyl-Q(34) synthetase GluQRS [Actinomycetia bacterium]|nr:tRNA glutamyl-Q(34) synthetase GluQRS [Actinomycetes bacterium]
MELSATGTRSVRRVPPSPHGCSRRRSGAWSKTPCPTWSATWSELSTSSGRASDPSGVGVAVGRYAPSPTGDLHLGNLRTAVVAWLLARHSGSRFLMRVEDLDPASRSGRFVDSQLDDLAALGLDWDGVVMFQSERIDAYRAAIDQLIESDLTFRCYCSRREIRQATQAAHDVGLAPRYPGTCHNLSEADHEARHLSGRPAALRFRGRGRVISLSDRIAGRYEGVVDDLVLRRNDGTPAYNIAVVVDDADQGVEEVTRGDDLLAATPAQLAVCEALDLRPPSYAHVPLVLGPGGERLAKRDGAVTLAELAARGVGAATVLSLIGHSLGLCALGESVDLLELLNRFDPAETAWTSWTVDEAQIA